MLRVSHKYLSFLKKIDWAKRNISKLSLLYTDNVISGGEKIFNREAKMRIQLWKQHFTNYIYIHFEYIYIYYIHATCYYIPSSIYVREIMIKCNADCCSIIILYQFNASYSVIKKKTFCQLFYQNQFASIT